MDHTSEIKPVVTEAVERKTSRTSDSEASQNEKRVADAEAQEFAHEKAVEQDEERSKSGELYTKYRPFILAALALVIMGWWISSTILKRTRHRWLVWGTIPRHLYN